MTPGQHLSKAKFQLNLARDIYRLTPIRLTKKRGYEITPKPNRLVYTISEAVAGALALT